MSSLGQNGPSVLHRLSSAYRRIADGWRASSSCLLEAKLGRSVLLEAKLGRSVLPAGDDGELLAVGRDSFLGATETTFLDADDIPSAIARRRSGPSVSADASERVKVAYRSGTINIAFATGLTNGEDRRQ